MSDRERPLQGAVAAIVAGSVVALVLWALGAPGGGSGGVPSPGASGSAGVPGRGTSGGSPAESGAGSPAGSGAGSPAGSTARELPSFGHVYLIVMENESLDSVIGNASAPYINGLASRGALATHDTAVAHPSQPNYLALWSGSTQGVTDDRVHDFASGTTLGDQIDASGRTWHVAAENVPRTCYTGATASGGEDGFGVYARKHEPAISWTSVSADPRRCANITDLRHFDPALGDLWLIVPNLCHDMHDCSIATGDAFLAGFVPRIVDSPAFADGVLFLTWDEGRGTEGEAGQAGGGLVPLIVASPAVTPGVTSDRAHSHFSLLRTIEDAWDLPCLAQACAADDLAELFR